MKMYFINPAGLPIAVLAPRLRSLVPYYGDLP
jgi:hypothetical protein